MRAELERALPEPDAALVGQAAADLCAGRSDVAVERLQPILEGLGGRKAVHWALAARLDAAGRPDLALRFAKMATDVDRRDPALWRFLADVATRADAPELARAARERAAREAQLAPVLEALSARERRGDDAGALAEAQRALGVAPGDAAVWMRSGAVLRRLGRYQEAALAFGRAVQLAPDDPRGIEARRQLAAARYVAGDVAAARDGYEAFARARREHAGEDLLAGRALVERRVASLREACAPDRYACLDAPPPSRVEPVVYQPPWDRDRAVLAPVPAVEVGELTDAEVWGRGDAVVRGEALVLASPSLDPRYRQDNVRTYSGMAREGPDGPRALLRQPTEATADLEAAVLVAGRADANYFHFLLEMLPRVVFAEALGEARAPLLVSRDMPAQHFEALDRLAPGRPRVCLEPASRVRVRRLVLPSLGGFVPDEARVDPCRVRVSPYAVRVLRERLLPPPGGPAEGPRRVALLRRSRVRRCLDEPALFAALERRGFAIVDPLELDFDAQRRLFAGADVVVSACGAALSNVIWMRPGAALWVLWGESVRPSFFAELAREVGVRMTFVRGQPVPGSHPNPVHRDFRIPLDALTPLLEDRLRRRPWRKPPRKGKRRRVSTKRV